MAKESKWLMEVRGILAPSGEDGISYDDLKKQVLEDKKSGKFDIKGKTPENSLYVHIFENGTKNTKSGKKNFSQFYGHIFIKNPEEKLAERIIVWKEDAYSQIMQKDETDSNEDIENDENLAKILEKEDMKREEHEYYKTTAKARRGQGFFRDKILEQYDECAITGIRHKKLLIASHIKPWAQSRKEREFKECIDGENGLLLSPLWDKLFDLGFISFDDSGKMLLSEYLDDTTKSEMKKNIKDIENFKLPFDLSDKQKDYMKAHRKTVFNKKCAPAE